MTKARGRKRVPTIYTNEGTAAHTVAETILRGEEAPKKLTVEGDTFDIDEEMLYHVDSYVDYVAKKSLDAALRIEERVHVSVAGEDLYGTTDALIFKEPHLEIVDLKYGQGVAVSADSSQLRIYALGALETIGPFADVETVTMTIVQPRAGGIKSDVLTRDELETWGDQILRPAVKRLADGDTTEAPGDHCRWCVRAGECQSLAALAMTNAKSVFDEATGDIAVPIDAQGWTNEELGQILETAEMVLAWVGKVRAEVSGRIDNGQVVPGWKLVPKRASRKWYDEDGAFAAMRDAGVPSTAITRIETIGNCEKALKKRKLKPEDVLYPFTIKESSGSTLVSDKDGREAVDTSAKNVFSDIDPFEIASVTGTIN